MNEEDVKFGMVSIILPSLSMGEGLGGGGQTEYDD